MEFKLLLITTILVLFTVEVKLESRICSDCPCNIQMAGLMQYSLQLTTTKSEEFYKDPLIFTEHQKFMVEMAGQRLISMVGNLKQHGNSNKNSVETY
jgi:hypothetical protein